MCADLHSSWVPLFIPCPNAKGFGENQDKWIPNPLSLTSLHLSMYAFVGKLMGIAIRGKHILNLDLPSIVWKQLVPTTHTHTHTHTKTHTQTHTHDTHARTPSE
jgi:E3 ubiquitin-protein ligase HERC2